ncbi:hypothetical protein [Streptomyces sp. NPDC056937]|uniref:hypothetical protein n=1 Tax=Streptomyces sp. NPDC056937 TaxID=3345969 RepID=UPI00363C553C
MLELVGRRPLLRRKLRAFADAGPDLVVDATRLCFASPLDLAAVAALARRGSMAGLGTELRLPTNASVASYVQRMDLIECLPPETRIVGHLPFDIRNDRRSILLETSPLTVDTVANVGKRIAQLAEAGLGEAAGRRVSRSIGELIDNAVSHGADSSAAFIAAQIYTGRTTGERGLEVAICDTGVGVLGHLRRNPMHKGVMTSVDALRRALEPGVTGTDELRGHGLTDALSHAGAGSPARLVLRSGDGLVRARLRPATVRGSRRESSPDWVDGTWAWLRVALAP